MKFPRVTITQYTIADLPDVTVLHSLSTAELRRKIDILMIDDEEFTREDNLKRSGFHIIHKYDIEDIKDVAPYAVIMCDIRGVGKAFGSEKEGAFLIREIKKCYPNKQVIAYTNSTYNPGYNPFLSYADYVIDKAVSLDDWVSILDDQISKVVDAQYQWKKLRDSLFEENVSTISIARLEDRYVKAIKNKSFTGFKELSDKTDIRAEELITGFVSSVFVKLITGVL